jgi:hypothetical protein
VIGFHFLSPKETQTIEKRSLQEEIFNLLWRTPDIPGCPTGSPYQTIDRERDIHQGRVFGDGGGSQFRDEKKCEMRYIYRHRL